MEKLNVYFFRHGQENRINEYRQRISIAEQSSVQVCKRVEQFHVEMKKINKLIDQVFSILYLIC